MSLTEKLTKFNWVKPRITNSVAIREIDQEIAEKKTNNNRGKPRITNGKWWNAKLGWIWAILTEEKSEAKQN